jgi:hypothetical protein
MDTKHTEHIKDDFLNGLVKLSDNEILPSDFTQKVMANIPKTVLVEQDGKSALKPWHWITIAAVSIGIIYFIITFDLTSILRQATSVTEDGGSNYLNMFTSMIQLFSTAFSGFQFTSITVMIIVSGVVLYLGDKFLRKWTSSRSLTVVF